MSIVSFVALRALDHVACCEIHPRPGTVYGTRACQCGAEYVCVFSTVPLYVSTRGGALGTDLCRVCVITV
jgi:hypothetical protein